MDNRLVAFDFDGVLVDTDRVMRSAFRKAYYAVGARGHPPFQEYVRHLGAPFSEIARKMRLPPEMEAHFRRASKSLAHLARPWPDGILVLRRLRKRGYVLALFTGKDAERTWQLLRNFGISRLFKIVVTGDDVRRGKPHPEGLHYILQRTGIAAENAIYVGD